MNLTTLILDREHHILVHKNQLPQTGCRSLQEFTKYFGDLGLNLGAPIGVAPPEFIFLSLERPKLEKEWSWISLRSASSILGDSKYWKLYTELMLGGYSPSSSHVDVFSFGNTPFMATRLAHLVIKGKKRATSGNPEALRKLGLTIPSEGLVSIVTDGFGIPLCCIQTERVEFRKYKDVPIVVAQGEGEGDLGLDDWRREHWKYFTDEAKKLTLTFTEETEIFTEWFRVLKVFGREQWAPHEEKRG